MESKHINDLRSRVGDLERQLREAKARLHEAEIEECGVAVGDVVMFHGEQFRVAVVEPSTLGGKPWLTGNRKKKDGTFGIARRRLYYFWSPLPADPAPHA